MAFESCFNVLIIVINLRKNKVSESKPHIKDDSFIK